MRNLFPSALAWTAVLYAASFAFAQSAPPSDDTYSLEGAPSRNFGNQPLLAVSTGTDSYIRFDLSGVPSGATVSKATLRLFVNAVAVNGEFDVFELGNTWSESTLNFDNAPVPGTSATDGHPVAVTSADMNRFVLVDITPLVQNWISGNTPNDGIALALSGSSGAFAFESKESTFTSHEPELEIVLSAPAGSPGQQGPAGPQGLQGLTGPAGPQGPQGLTGSQGPAGPAGTQGPAGPQGPAGLPGANGLPAIAGPTGPAGPQGPAGPAGQSGLQVWSSNITVPFSSFDSSRLFPVLGVGTVTDEVVGSGVSFAPNLIPVPRGCTAGNFTAVASWGGGSLLVGAPVTFSLGATTDVTGFSGAPPVLTCSTNTGSGFSPVSCQSSATAVIPPNSYIINEANDPAGVGLTGGNVMVSFTCQ